MTATLTKAEYRILTDALTDAAGNATTEKREDAIWAVRNKLDRERNRADDRVNDPTTIRMVIETVRRTKRVQQITDAMLDEIAAALIEDRTVDIKRG